MLFCLGLILLLQKDLLKKYCTCLRAGGFKIRIKIKFNKKKHKKNTNIQNKTNLESSKDVQVDVQKDIIADQQQREHHYFRKLKKKKIIKIKMKKQ